MRIRLLFRNDLGTGSDESFASKYSKIPKRSTPLGELDACWMALTLMISQDDLLIVLVARVTEWHCRSMSGRFLIMMTYLSFIAWVKPSQCFESMYCEASSLALASKVMTFWLPCWPMGFYVDLFDRYWNCVQGYQWNIKKAAEMLEKGELIWNAIWSLNSSWNMLEWCDLLWKLKAFAFTVTCVSLSESVLRAALGPDGVSLGAWSGRVGPPQGHKSGSSLQYSEFGKGVVKAYGWRFTLKLRVGVVSIAKAKMDFPS
jgi:hypothetical protein